MATKKESKEKRLGNVQKVAWSLDEIAAATGLSRDGLQREVKAGNLEILKVGRRTIVLDEKLQAWLTSKSPMPKAG